MPHPTLRHRHVDALWFPEAGHDRYNEPLRGEPVEVKVRPLEGAGISQTALARGVVADFTIVVDREMRSGWVYFGTLAEWRAAGSGSGAGELLVITAYSETPDVKGRRSYREVTLAFSKDAEPDGA